MIHIIKNYKWVIASSLVCIIFGLLTFFTFINQSFIKLNDYNLQVLLIIDLFLLIIFFTLVIYETYKILNDRRKGKLGSETSLRYILFFSTTTLLPSILIAIFSLILFNVGLQKYFEKCIKRPGKIDPPQICFILFLFVTIILKIFLTIFQFIKDPSCN